MTCQRINKRGYTLVELMIVVVIMGVLATLAVYGVRKYVAHSKTAEAFTMIGAIVAAQESYRDETFVYLDTTLGGAVPLYPQGDQGTLSSDRYAWQGHTGEQPWRVLGVSTNTAVMYGYACRAGSAGQSPGSIPEWDGDPNLPNAPGEPWFVAYALGDQDDDDDYAVFFSSSFSSQLLAQREAE